MSERFQGTVSVFDPETLSGRVLRDDGVEVGFDASAISGSGLRLLRLGQRVRWVQEAPDGPVLGLQILTLH